MPRMEEREFEVSILKYYYNPEIGDISMMRFRDMSRQCWSGVYVDIILVE